MFYYLNYGMYFFGNINNNSMEYNMGEGIII